MQCAGCHVDSRRKCSTFKGALMEEAGILSWKAVRSSGGKPDVIATRRAGLFIS